MYRYFILVLISLAGFGQSFTIAVDEPLNSVVSPYISQRADFAIIKDALYGKRLFYPRNKNYVSDIIQSIEINKDVVTLELKRNSPIPSETIAFSFKHYKTYFSKSQNWNYYVFSRMQNIRSTEGAVSFNINEKGLVKRSILSVYLLSEGRTQENTRDGVFRLPVNFNGYGSFVLRENKKNRAVLRKKLTVQTSSISEIQLSYFSRQSNIVSRLSQNGFDLYLFDHIKTLANQGSFIDRNYRRRMIHNSKNEVTALLINGDVFPKEKRMQFKSLIPRNRLQQRIFKYTGRVAVSLFPLESAHYHQGFTNTYNPVEAMTAIEKYNFVNKVKNTSKEKPHTLIFYRNNPLMEELANSIALNFDEAGVFVVPKGLSSREYENALKSKNYSFALTHFSFSNGQYYAAYRLMNTLGLFGSTNVKNHLNRLTQFSSIKNTAPIVQLLQRRLNDAELMFPLFIIEKKQALIRKKFRTYATREKSGETYNYKLLEFELWQE